LAIATFPAFGRPYTTNWLLFFFASGSTFIFSILVLRERASVRLAIVTLSFVFIWFAKILLSGFLKVDLKNPEQLGRFIGDSLIVGILPLLLLGVFPLMYIWRIRKKKEETRPTV
jgi:hypothetical protein